MSFKSSAGWLHKQVLEGGIWDTIETMADILEQKKRPKSNRRPADSNRPPAAGTQPTAGVIDTEGFEVNSKE